MVCRYCTKTLSGHGDWVRTLDVDESGRLVATGSNDQTVRVWDISTGECKAELRGHDHVVEFVSFFPLSSYAAIRELTQTNPEVRKLNPTCCYSF